MEKDCIDALGNHSGMGGGRRMRAVGIVVEPFTLINVLKIEGIRALNQHGSLKITGIIGQEKEKEYQRMAMDEVWVKVDAVGERGEQERFFCGLLTSIFFHKDCKSA